jgi:hypothetical protein
LGLAKNAQGSDMRFDGVECLPDAVAPFARLG